MRRRLTVQREGDRGAVLVIVALAMVALLVIAALVIDLSFVRQNRQFDKSAADMAAAAGVRSLDTGTGASYPFRGVCTALDFLESNGDQFVGLRSTGTFSTVGTPAVAVANPCSSAVTCTASTTTTWALFRGATADNKLRVRIQSGYDLASSSFGEDQIAGYAADPGADPCDQLAIIIEEDEDAKFGGAGGSEGHTTEIRSVARVNRGFEGEIAAALILLERRSCRVIVSGGTDARILVSGKLNSSGAPVTPGLIHSDSNGEECSNSSGNIFHVNGSTTQAGTTTPRIVAGQGGGFAGEITVRALNPGEPGARTSWVSGGNHETCPQVNPAQCGGPSATFSGGQITGRPLVTRSIVDVRYRESIAELRDLARRRFDWATTDADDDADATQFVRINCGDAIPSVPRVWVDCAGGEFNGSGKTFSAGTKEIVINGWVSSTGDFRITGSTPAGAPSTHVVEEPLRVFVRGRAGQAAVTLPNASNRLLMNDGGASATATSACAGRASTAPKQRAQLVIGAGYLYTNGGALRLCQTTVFMMEGAVKFIDEAASPPAPCPVPGANGSDNVDNSCSGVTNIGGNGVLDWTAPNMNATGPPSAAELLLFEDLAMWSESTGTSGSGAWSLGGSGSVTLGGIFFSPNANPFTLSGGSAFNIQDAQFVTRKLVLGGGGALTMRPDSNNAVRLPAIGSYSLVR